MGKYNKAENQKKEIIKNLVCLPATLAAPQKTKIIIISHKTSFISKKKK